MDVDALVNGDTLWNLLIRFFLNLIVIFILVRGVYYKFSKKEEYFFSFILIGIMIFMICSILKSIDIQIGMALGLFAIFAILRFRTITYSVKDMTYVFIIIGISVVNSQAHIPPPVLGAILFNCIIILITYYLEIYLQKKYLNKIILIYNDLKLLRPSCNKDLLKDLSRITGQNIEKVIIQKIDVGKGNAELEAYFKDKRITR